MVAGGRRGGEEKGAEGRRRKQGASAGDQERVEREARHGETHECSENKGRKLRWRRRRAAGCAGVVVVSVQSQASCAATGAKQDKKITVFPRCQVSHGGN